MLADDAEVWRARLVRLARPAPPARGSAGPALMRRPGLAPGLLLGAVLDAVLADPAAGHPVAAFGSAAARVERLLWADSRPRGALFVLACVGPVMAAARAADLVAARPGSAGQAARAGQA
ncbi:MAG: cobalamin biosynthesis protein, partial [Streptosporangiaceae bacterium]